MSDSNQGGVRALTRGLAILSFINSRGAVSVAEIARGIGIPRPSAYRLLQTLEADGYVVHSASDSRVRVTRLAASLGDGFVRSSEVCQVAGPILAKYASRLVWPIDLSVYENAAMVIQETTHGRSPLSIDRGMIGVHLPMLRSSAGRAYLGHCSASERGFILKQLRYQQDPEDLPYFKPGLIETMIAEVRRTGRGVRIAGEFRTKTSSLAVPILSERGVVAVVSVIWIRTALSLDDAAATFTAHLREMAQEIAGALESRP